MARKTTKTPTKAKKARLSSESGGGILELPHTSRSNWKSVAVDGKLASTDENFEFLIDFQELDADEIVDNCDTSALKSDKGRKRKKCQNEKAKKSKKSKPADQTTTNFNESTIPNLQQGASRFSDEQLSVWTSLGVPEKLALALCQKGFLQPTEIQKRALPASILARKDILGAAETGSGKTLAFGLPILSHLFLEKDSHETDRISNGVRALIITPTRELAVQIKNHLGHFSEMIGVKSQSTSKSDDTSYLSNLSDLKFLVIDETDRMMEKGHFEQLEHIVKMAKNDRERHNSVITYVYSATLTYSHPKPNRCVEELGAEDKIASIASTAGLRAGKFELIDVSSETRTARGLAEARINCDDLTHKDTILYYLLTAFKGRTLIFTNSIDCARRLYNILSILKLTPLLLHAKMQQRQRLKNLERFSANEDSILLATDVAARGLDIPNVQNVIHYQVPKTAEVYVHRSGRTARAAQRGLAVMLIDPLDGRFYRRICDNLAKSADLPIFPVDNSNLMSLCSERVKLASNLDRTQHKESKKKARDGWFKKMAKDADLAEFSDASSGDMDDSIRQSKTIRDQLSRLLAQPLPDSTSCTAKGHTKYLTSDLVQSTMEMREKKSKVAASALAALQQSAHDDTKMKKMRKNSKKKCLPVGSKLRGKGGKKSRKLSKM